MGLFHLAKLFGITLRESADDGSDFANPDADHRVVFLGEDAQLHAKDSSGTVTSLSGGGVTVEDEGTPLSTTATTLDFVGAGVTATGSGAEKTITIPGASFGASDIERRTAGDLTVSSTSAGAALGTIGDNVVAAVAGDLLLIGISCIVDADSAASTRMDVGTIVSAAVVNYVSSLSGTPATVGIPAWRVPPSVEVRLGATIPYVVQAGDLSGGNVTLSLRAWNSSADNRNLQASTGAPLVFWVKNLKQ